MVPPNLVEPAYVAPSLFERKSILSPERQWTHALLTECRVMPQDGISVAPGAGGLCLTYSSFELPALAKIGRRETRGNSGPLLFSGYPDDAIISGGE